MQKKEKAKINKKGRKSSQKRVGRKHPRNTKKGVSSGGSFMAIGVVLLALFFIGGSYLSGTSYTSPVANVSSVEKEGGENVLIEGLSNPGNSEEPVHEEKPTLDKEKYDRLMQELANCPKVEPDIPYTLEATKEKQGYECIWPAEGNPYPEPGALLPYNRIVAYYGNFYSKNMGILGEYSTEVVLDKLMAQVRKWKKADPNTPVIPAIDYIAVTAQASAGVDGNFNLRMPDDQLEHAIDMANQVDGIVILEVQAGLSNLQKEVKLLEKFLKKPKVHLAIDPEFHMRRGNEPGEWIGTVTALDVNQTIEYLSELVKKYDLPPKILLVHAFTKKMIQNEPAIKPTPQVQVVVVMDGWGPKHLKRSTWRRVIQPNPIQFTGFKVFYENDTWAPSTGIMSPEEILDLRPKPIYIQYQ